MNIVEQAAWVHQLANIEYFKEMLAAFQAAAIEKGFIFVEGTEHYVLAESDLEFFGRVIMQAKLKFVHPRISDTLLERWTHESVETGEAEKWVQTLLDGLAKREIALTV